MPTPTYVAIAKTVLTTTQSSITLNSIPSTYTDLLLVVSARNDSASVGIENIRLRPNNSTSLVYSFTIGYSSPPNGASTNSSGNNNINIYGNPGGSTTANTFGNIEIYIPNYTSSTNKPISYTSVGENNDATMTFANVIGAGLWSDTTTISSIVLQSSSGSFVSGSRFDLYGIKNS